MRIDRYELFGSFATGGMASVHFGKLFASAGFQRVVAIKVPHANVLGDPEFRAMFVDEARIVARIRNPHVVATLDIIEKGETLYQVMEYASGPTLSFVLSTARAREEPVPLPVVLAILVDTLEGLHAAHELVDERGAALDVVHRDVSPQNILVTEDGVAKIIDFGIASATGKQHLTRPGDVRGKASYMSPEQVHGKRADRRADVYAAGIVLYETLTGKRPFAGEDFASTAMMHVLQEVPDPRASRPDIPDDLAAIVGRALEKAPRDRFPTARAMADALIGLPMARATTREMAEWLDDVAGDFFAARRALIAALPSIEDAPPAPTSVPTAPASGARVDPKSTEPTRAEPRPALVQEPARERRRLRGVAAAAAALVTAGTLAIVLAARSQGRSKESSNATATPGAATLVSSSASSALARPAPEPQPPKPLVRPETSAAVEAPSPTASGKLPSSPTRGRSPAKSDGGGAAKTSPSPSASAAPPTAPCCAGDLRIRFSNCLDNCPSGS